MTNRKDFLCRSAVAFAAPWLAAAATDPLRNATSGAIHLGCVTHTLFADYDLDSIIRILEEAGFEGVELRTTTASPAGQKHGVEPSINQADRARVRKRFERSKIELVSFGSVCEFQSPDAAERKRNVEEGKRFVDLAKDMGAIGVKVRPYGLPKDVPKEVTVRNIGVSLRELGEYAAAKDIGIWLEFHNEGFAETKQMMEIAGVKSVGLCWNSQKSDVVGGSVKTCFDILGPWVRDAHIHTLSDPTYPYRELFSLMHAARFSGWTFYEGAATGKIEDFLKAYKTEWTKLTRF